MYDVLQSPFLEHQSPFTAWEACKLLLLLPAVPVRLVIILAVLLWVALCNTLAVLGCDLSQPLPSWRRHVVELTAVGSRAVLALCGFWRIHVRGRENLDKARQAGALAVFNHVSYADPFVVVWLLGCPCGVSKAANKSLPVIGTAIRALQNVYVENDGPARGAAGGGYTPSSELIKERVRDRRFPMLVIAPEGTTGNGRCLLQFKTGAFRPGAPVLPVVLDYRRNVHHNLGYGIIHPLMHFLRTMTQFANHLDIDILPVYLPSEQERQDPALYAQNVRLQMAAHLGVPPVDQDRSTLKALERLGVRPSWGGQRVVAPPGVLSEDGRYVDLDAAQKKNKAA